jgi:hypothetical protein
MDWAITSNTVQVDVDQLRISLSLVYQRYNLRHGNEQVARSVEHQYRQVDHELGYHL